MIRYSLDNKDTGVQVTSDLFSACNADPLDEKRFLQMGRGRFLCFALNFSRPP